MSCDMDITVTIKPEPECEPDNVADLITPIDFEMNRKANEHIQVASSIDPLFFVEVGASEEISSNDEQGAVNEESDSIEEVYSNQGKEDLVGHVVMHAVTTAPAFEQGREPRLRAIPEQFAAIIEFMEKHGDLSRPAPGLHGRLRVDRLWQQLSRQLNLIRHGVRRSHDKWKKVWADWKTKTKKKHNMLIKYHASGNSPSNRQILTVLEERVLGTMGVVVSKTNIQRKGFNTQSEILQQIREHEDNNVQFAPKALNYNTAPQPLPSRPLPSPPTHPDPPPTRPRLISGQTITSKSNLKRRIRQTSSTSEFVAIEQRRLKLEQERDRLFHRREIERLRLESERIAATREQTQMIVQLGIIAQQMLDILSEKRQNQN